MKEDKLQLTKSLSLFGLVLFGLAYMTPMIVFGTYGVLYEESGGNVASSYLFALIAMLFTAGSYALMAHKYPSAGSSYTYVTKVFGDRIGFLVGWTILLDYLFLPMVIWLIGGIYLEAMAPGIPEWFWILSFIVVTSVLNLIGVNVAKKVNLVLMLLQIVVIVAFCALAVMYINASGGVIAAPSTDSFTGGNFSLIFSGAAIACYSFLGFDAVSTMAEETENPKKNVPKAIMLVTLIGGIIFVASSYILNSAFPDISVFAAESAAADIAKQVGGVIFSSIFVATLIIAQFTSGVSAQASASRLMYVMGRDGVLPKGIFGKLHATFKTPYMTILMVGFIGLLALKMDVATSTSFINFGAFIAFIFVNMSAFSEFFKLEKNERTLGATLIHIVFPSIGTIAVMKLLISLDSNAVMLGCIWLAIGLCYLAYLITKGQKLKMDIKES
ncbi:APC family permease [Colwellia psychrerythraea]|uniref:Amino acid permease family protein n=1 Tax=Colwellia psychrerythraea (strain 34H / ATCC BAA-681) TaxID=167879 RepID=Q483K9_COLP3|nr:APC family permease [Colwellia psychrerythraea]AAZ28008.1 amino acid permease family protein [Colwellia psychrerythraea 34H]